MRVPFSPLIRRVADFVIPPRCHVCGVVVGSEGGLCGVCFSALYFLSGPLCARCGHPLPGEAEAGEMCVTCATDPGPFSCLRAAVAYDSASKPLVLGLKHADRLETVPILAGWMRRAGEEMLAQADLIVPVPLHRRRLFQRRYNQAAELARYLARESPAAFAPLSLGRCRATPSQGGFGPAGRARNVQGAFYVPFPQAVRGKRVLLVDDVLTTGATLKACGRTLLKAGARDVQALVLARVLAEESRPVIADGPGDGVWV